jgi:hypothetical protein
MDASTRQGLADTALALAGAVKSNDADRVRSMTVAQYAAEFGATAYLLRTTAAKLANDTPHVTQAYLLDASSRQPNEATEADFACPLIGSTGEVDFSIAALPRGRFAFVMVEASGEQPWLLAFLLEQEGSAWKMAGFYPHARAAAGHDGLWYWQQARTDAKSGQRWLAWMLYGEADQLLRPASFVATTHLDELRAERRTNAPPELADGISVQKPLVIKDRSDTEFRFTALDSEASDDDRGLNLIVHFAATPVSDAAAEKARNLAAAKALLTAHPELRQGFSGVAMFADIAGQPPFATVEEMGHLQ